MCRWPHRVHGHPSRPSHFVRFSQNLGAFGVIEPLPPHVPLAGVCSWEETAMVSFWRAFSVTRTEIVVDE
jgi:hypothetical protein